MSLLLRLEKVSKEFYGTQVLSDVTFTLACGEILGLVGENGAGKSVLMRILFGMPDIAETGGYGGRIYLGDTLITFNRPAEALYKGIGMVHQEFSLIPGFTAAENVLLNREPIRSGLGALLFGKRLGLLNRNAMTERSDHRFRRLGVPIAADTPASAMPVGHKQFTEIARELDRDHLRLLILDEPTAALTETEAAVLLNALKGLAREGIGIIFISHRLREIAETADRIVVLRDGVIVKDVPNSRIPVMDIASWMMGRTVTETAEPGPSRRLTGEALRIERLRVDMPGETVHDVSFAVQKGEIFGIGGLAGQGKLGIPNGIMGLYAATGTVYLDGAVLPLGNPKTPLDAGMAFVSEDRRGAGLLLHESIALNIAFGVMQIQGGCLKSYLSGLFKLRDEKAMYALAEEYIRKLDIKCTGPHQKAQELSGGNQQKICLAKAFALEPKLLFVSEPTRGVDIGAKKTILDTLRSYNRNSDTAVVLVSSELEELRLVCDRIAIVAEGRIAGILPPHAAVQRFGLLMAGYGEP